MRHVLYTIGFIALVQFSNAEPPFQATTQVEPDLLTPEDPSVFEKVTYDGVESRKVFDRRVEKFEDRDMHILKARFSDVRSVEVRVNTEFTKDEAIAESERYLFMVGQLPFVLREDMDTVTIHKGLKPQGGGNRNLLIHTDQAEKLREQDVLEETFFHEATHTSVDDDHAKSKGWIEAQGKDTDFLTMYGKNNPWREDVAGTFIMYFALRVLPDRLDETVKKKVEETVPNRLAYFDEFKFDWTPWGGNTKSSNEAQSPASTSSLPAEEWRDFTNTGGVTIRAKVVSLEGDEVTIQREDGQRFTIPIATLSSDDQAYLKSLSSP
jgi:hypothetical protein